MYRQSVEEWPQLVRAAASASHQNHSHTSRHPRPPPTHHHKQPTHKRQRSALDRAWLAVTRMLDPWSLDQAQDQAQEHQHPYHDGHDHWPPSGRLGPSARRHRRSRLLLVASMSGMMALEIAAFVAATPALVWPWVRALWVLISAGVLVWALCRGLRVWTRARPLGNVLCRRFLLWTWPRDRARLVLEAAAWMTAVWRAQQRSLGVAMVAGVAGAIAIKVVSEMGDATLRNVQAQVMTPRQRKWTKQLVRIANLSSAAMVVAQRKVDGTRDVDAASRMHVMAVSTVLVVLTEVLLLCGPTWRTKYLRQTRRPTRTPARWWIVLKAWGGLAVASLVYGFTHDGRLALRLGIFASMVLVFGEDLVSFDGFETEDVASVKTMVLCVTTMWAFIAGVVANVGASSGPAFMSLVWLPAFVAVGLGFLGGNEMDTAGETALKFVQIFGFKVCVLGTAFSTWMWRHEWMPTLFYGLFSSFCVSLSRDLGDRAVGTFGRTTLHSSRGVSRRICRYLKQHHPCLYRRAKMTLLTSAFFAAWNICSTIFQLLVGWPYDHSHLLLAGSILISTGVGFLTSSGGRVLSVRDLIVAYITFFKDKWVFFPLHSFLETAMFLTVSFGAILKTSSVLIASALGGMSCVLVCVCSEWICTRLNWIIPLKHRVHISDPCALFYGAFFNWAAVVSILYVFEHISRLEVAFCLSVGVGILCLTASEILLHWHPTRLVGYLLQHRLTHAKENWRNDTLRSFLEVFAWLAVTYGLFALRKDLLFAIQLGTLSGIAMALTGEYGRSKHDDDPISYAYSPRYEAVAKDRKAQLQQEDEVTRDVSTVRPHLLPSMMFFAFMGSGVFLWIFERIPRLEIMILLATVAGAALLCAADLLVMFKRTRWAGVLLQDRLVRAKENWKTYPVRSFVEVECIAGVILGSYAIYGDLIAAMQYGTLSGMLVVLIGEQLRHHAIPAIVEPDDKEGKNILPFPVIVLVGFAGVVALNLIYTHFKSLEIACVLATASGVAFVLIGDMFVIWKPTRKIGLIMQDRIVGMRINLKSHPRRTWCELVSFGISWYWAYVWFWPHDFLIGAQFGTFVGIMACVCGDLTQEYVTDFEAHLVQNDNQTFPDPQEQSAFLVMPYEVQFEMAKFLSPEELLVTRATCRKVDNMLRAQSNRYWLHASIRRRLDKETCMRLQDQAGKPRRSLFCEAITLLVGKMINTRSPTQVLSSSIELNRTLKWIYVNADWIRSHHLDASPKVLHGGLVRVSNTDAVFQVFRHMPGKEKLGIVVHCDHDATIQNVDVPVDIFKKLRIDPLHFVAAESLSGVEAFSLEHMVMAMFVAMIAVFTGPFIADLFARHISPLLGWC